MEGEGKKKEKKQEKKRQAQRLTKLIDLVLLDGCRDFDGR
jgi:hypothetical protein